MHNCLQQLAALATPFQTLMLVQAYVADGPAEQWQLDGIVWHSQN